MPYQKSIQQYRRDIFALKTKLKQDQKYLQQLKQKHSDIDVLGNEDGYSFKLKLKILEYNLLGIRQTMEQYMKDQATDVYALNFSTLALIKSCQIFQINKQMIFRAIDIKSSQKIQTFQFTNFLKQTLHLNQQFIDPLIKILDSQATSTITKSRYNKFLQCFLINAQQDNRQINTIDEAISNVVKQMVVQKIQPERIWKIKQINIGIFVHGLMRNVKNVDMLDCVGLYCKLDPLKKGYLLTKEATGYLANKVQDFKNFDKLEIRLKK